MKGLFMPPSPPVPANELERLDALHAYAILDTAAEAQFDAITELAASICEAPIALISLVDEKRQWFKSRRGLPEGIYETPREVAFCAHAIAQSELFIVQDAHTDPRFQDNPLVTGVPHVHFYAGMPLRSHEGHALGTVCVIDQVSRALSPVQRRTLAHLGQLTERLLEERKQRALMRCLMERDRIAQEELLQYRHQLEAMVDERTAALKEAIARAQAANEAKAEFLANMSHELRTPMHAILSSARMGNEKAGRVGCNSTKLQGYFIRVETAANRLMGLLDNLLNLSKMEAGRREFRKRPHDLAQLCKMGLSEFEASAQETAVSLAIRVADKPVMVDCDESAVLEVVTNLVSNALKFTPAGGNVTLVAWQDEQSAEACVAVLDTGCGLPEDEKDAVFERFEQSSRTRTKAGGTGLGLAICKEIVHAHGGRIWAENRLGGGAAFTFTLPLSHSEKAQPQLMNERC